MTAYAAVAGFSLTANAAMATTIAEANHWQPYFLPPHALQIAPAALERLAAAGATIPLWHSLVKSPLDGKTYTYQMVGSSPFAAAASTTVPFVPIVLKVSFGSGIVLDPTKPGCKDTVAVESRFFGSPLFKPVNVASNGVSVGPAQLTDAFQRANFWTVIKGSSKYHVRLASALTAPIVLTVNAPAGSLLYKGVCAGSNHYAGAIDINAWDAIVRTVVNKYAKPNELPIVETYNVFQTQGGQCCILGYHDAYARSTGVQTYAVGAYNDAGFFSVPIEDIHAWSHEIGEWMDDPFGNNPTPAWGHIGQVSGCQNNLEVGDPLTGTAYTGTFNGFTYHPQELAFFSWFYRVASTATGGKFSFEGTFKKAQGACS